MAIIVAALAKPEAQEAIREASTALRPIIREWLAEDIEQITKAAGILH